MANWLTLGKYFLEPGNFPKLEIANDIATYVTLG